MNVRVFAFSFTAVLLGWVVPSFLSAQGAEEELTQDEIKFFESKVRPILVASCYECHSPDEKIRGGLTLDTKAGIRAGGDTAEAVVPHDLEASLLWDAVTWSDPDYEMPPRRKLPDEEIEILKQWILMGAPDPRVAETQVVKTEIDIEEGKKFWSFQKPEKPLPPLTEREDWARTEVDQFVLTRLEEEQLTPVPEAESTTLLRRLHMTLIGIPPSPEEVIEFHEAWKVDEEIAYAYKVDELLNSPHFGERWGRHWMDVSRYAESTGASNNQLYPHAWRYRDYVIDSFNADKPYDEFIMEQIAGDLLPAATDEEWQEHLIATGFLALGVKGLNDNSARQFQMDLVDEQIDTTTQAVMGLTVSCARCHDHKFDPIPTADYYAMAGIFLSTDTYYGTTPGIQNRRSTELLLLPIEDAEPVSRVISPEEIVSMNDRAAEMERELFGLRGSNAPNIQQQFIRLRTQSTALRHQANTFKPDGTPKTFAMGVQDGEYPVNAEILVRGEIDKPAQEVDRGFVQVIEHAETPELPTNGSGRLELAEWMVSDKNPLTARVFVNRVWQHLFGQGLVTSPDNFGATGQAPSHPELLDYLAVQFVEDGWSVKSLIRDLVLSSTWRLSSDFNSSNYHSDPDNVYLWRANQRQLDAEILRDSILAASGQLDLEPPVASRVNEVATRAPVARITPGLFNVDESYRSVYLPIVRDNVPESLQLFDFAEPSLVTGSRESTNVPSQALFLMNNEFIINQANAMAHRILEAEDQPRARFSLAFILAYGRLGTEDEINSAVSFFRTFKPAALKETGNEEEASFLAMSAFCQGLLASAEFRYLN